MDHKTVLRRSSLLSTRGAEDPGECLPVDIVGAANWVLEQEVHSFLQDMVSQAQGHHLHLSERPEPTASKREVQEGEDQKGN